MPNYRSRNRLAADYLAKLRISEATAEVEQSTEANQQLLTMDPEGNLTVPGKIHQLNQATELRRYSAGGPTIISPAGGQQVPFEGWTKPFG